MGMPWVCGSKPVLEVCTQFPAPPIGNEHAALGSEQLTVWGASFGLLTLVKVKIGVTVKVDEKVPPSEVVVVKLIVPVSLWVASETAT
jgi:hypothetical protein